MREMRWMLRVGLEGLRKEGLGRVKERSEECIEVSFEEESLK